VKSTTEECGRH